MKVVELVVVRNLIPELPITRDLRPRFGGPLKG